MTHAIDCDMDVDCTCGVKLPALIERLKADLAYHQAEAAEITRDSLDIDTADPGAYSVEADCSESYHTGRVEALKDVINLLAGVEVTLYSETED